MHKTAPPPRGWPAGPHIAAMPPTAPDAGSDAAPDAVHDAAERGGAPSGVPLGVPVFQAIITPHRSLSPAGLRRVIAALLLLSATVSTGLWFVGAWPVVGFNGAEMLLAIVLLRRNALERRREERLVLTDTGLHVVRRDLKGRQAVRRLGTAWLNAVLQDRPGRTPALLLVERGRQLEVGALLGEAEKRDLAAALRLALHHQRNPVFDNPQLRPAVTPPPDPST